MYGPHNFLWGGVHPSVSMGNRVAIMAHWLVDVCANINIGNNVLLAGQYGQIWTHTFDLQNNRLDFSLKMGNNIYIGSGCIICGNVTICDDVVISAGSSVLKPINETGVYGMGHQLLKTGGVHDFSKLYSNGIEIKQKVTRAEQYTIFQSENKENDNGKMR